MNKRYFNWRKSLVFSHFLGLLGLLGLLGFRVLGLRSHRNQSKLKFYRKFLAEHGMRLEINLGGEGVYIG